MNSSAPQEPAADAAGRWHQQLLQADPVASAEVAEAYFPLVIDWLASVAPKADPQAREEAAGTAVLDFIKNPAAYRPAKLELGAYLRMAALRDLQNVLRRERRHQRNRRGWNLVEQAADGGKYLGRDDDPSLRLQIAEAESRAIPDRVLQGLNDAERRVLELMLRRERRTAAFAAALGITDLPVEEQRREVKRVKDRLGKRVQRAEARHGWSP